MSPLMSDDPSSDVMGLTNPLNMPGATAIGILTPPQRWKAVEELMDAGVNFSDRKKAELVKDFIYRRPRLMSQVQEVNEVPGLGVGGMVIGSRNAGNPRGQAGWGKALDNLQDWQRQDKFNTPVDRSLRSPQLSISINPDSSTEYISSILPHEVTHVAQIVRNPQRFTNSYARRLVRPYEPPGNTPGYAFLDEVPWSLRPEEISANLAGLKYFPGSFEPKPNNFKPFKFRIDDALENAKSRFGSMASQDYLRGSQVKQLDIAKSFKDFFKNSIPDKSGVDWYEQIKNLYNLY
jgi:hypothetical protein